MKKYAIIFSIFIFCVSAAAYTRITMSDGTMPKWTSMPVSYWINDKGYPPITNGSDFAAVQAAFHTWEQVSTADIRFNYMGTTPVGSVSWDGFNVISFTDASTPLGSTTIAATFSYFRSELGDDGVIRQVFSDSDILFNTTLNFSTSGENGKYDIQSLLTHEIGHFLGLDHSAMISSVMAPFGLPSQLDQRTLAYDDIAGIMEIYPKAPAAVGQIQGTIRSGTSGILGAHVVAVTNDGTALVSALSQPDGSYILRYLPPGAYRVFAEPLDLPVTRDFIGQGAAGFYGNTRTDFGTTYFGNVSTLDAARAVNVTANGSASADIQTLPQNATSLNLTRPAFAPRFPLGSNGILTVGGADIKAGVSFTASNPSLVLGVPAATCDSSTTTNCFGGSISAVAATSAKMNLQISSSTPLGPKNLAVSRGADVSIGTGIVVITNTAPAGIQVAPGSGPAEGGSLVTITGNNFRSGAQVYFAGLPALSVRVVDSGTITATTPPSTPGFANVVVVNSDGTWTVSPQTFSYTTAPPIVTAISPPAGPPSTLVTIQGDHFGTLKQNVQVTFGGVAARIVSITANTIQAVVPYGAVNGPVEVTAVGQKGTGPNFTVTSLAISSNLAVSAYDFQDASASSDGTPLSFPELDDAVSLVPLPFTFSIFGDIYAAGERISISTNGWISLDGASDRAYQNSTLPAASVAQSTGGTGAVPPSLIAPFWSDLVLEPGTSNVSTRVIGTAPNRRFVVEWSHASIILQSMTDVNADLNFEAILFEGSNDIQFVYQTMSGQLSDGSTATVGAQDLKRTTAILSSFNQPTVRGSSYITYSYRNGNYAAAAGSLDSTPPTVPVVTDEGALTSNGTQLAASWASADPESGITGFQYAVGTTPGGTEVKPFTSTAQNSAVVTGLTLQTGTTYYFAVKATNGVGSVSAAGVSDGIRYDPAFQPQTKIIPSSPENSSEYSGIALLAPSAMTVVLRAYDSSGNLILGAGIRNPSTISLAPGQQSAKLLSELFGLQNFDGWIEAQASAAGLGIFTATGGWDTSTLDGSVARDPSSDFFLFHAGAAAIMVNPSTRTANVSINGQVSTIPPRGRLVTTVPGIVHVLSSEALAVVERVASPGKLSINTAVPATDAQSTLVFPQAVGGGGYNSIVKLANVSGVPQDIIVSVPTSASAVQRHLDANGSLEFSILAFGGLPNPIQVGAVRVVSTGPLVGVIDIGNQNDPVTIGARPAATDFSFPQVANGNGLFTGLALATGSSAAAITIDVYDPSGATKKSGTITLGANQQLAKLVSELVSGVATQVGGYIRLRSDQPIWAWEIYGSDLVMASGPPL